MDGDEGVSSRQVRILFVDDDSIVLKAARLLLTRHDYEMFEARSAEEGRALIEAMDFDLILLDLNFARGAVTGAEGLSFLSDILRRDRDRAVVVVTAHSGINIAVKAMRIGAIDFITKPWRNERFLDAIRGGLDAARRRRSEKEEKAEPRPPLGSVLGPSREMARIRDVIARSAPTDASVLISGGPGAGKTLIAEHIHLASRRRQRPLLRLRLAGMPAAQIDAQLEARLAGAEGGTLLLQGVEALPEAAMDRVEDALRSGLRMLSTTRLGTAELERTTLAQRGLTYQLGTVEIAIPALHSRPQDITAIADHYFRVYARRYGRDLPPPRPEALALLAGQSWPGGVRQLIQLVERAVVLERPMEALLADRSGEETLAAGPAGDLNLEQSERRLIERSLARNGSNVTRAALELGLTRAALYRRMQKYGL